MPVIQQRLSLLICLFFIAFNCRAEIYQCKDSSGRIEFKDSPCSGEQAQLKKQAQLLPLNIDYGGSNRGQAPLAKRGGRANLLRNADFTSEILHWALSTEGVYWSDSLGVAGGGALVMNADLPPDDNYIYETKAEQCVELNGSREYFLSARLLLDKTPQQRSAHRANVIWYGSKDCSVSGTFGGYIEPDSSSGRLLLESRALKPTMDAVAAKIQLVQKGRSSNQGRAIWDDIHFHGLGSINTTELLERPYVAGNFIINGDFRESLESWGNSSRAEWSAFVRYKSSGSVRTWVRSRDSSLGVGVLDQCVLLGRADLLELGAYVKIDDYASSQGGGGRLRLSWYDDDQCRGKYQAGRKHADIKVVKGWQHLQVKDIEVPATARAAKVQLIQSVSGSGVFVVNWDDIYLKR